MIKCVFKYKPEKNSTSYRDFVREMLLKFFNLKTKAISSLIWNDNALGSESLFDVIF